jgi:histone deacetylase 1/2
MEDRKRKVAYFYDPEYDGMYYGADHPMKPPRIAMTHHLVLGYGMHQGGMDVYKPRRAQAEELSAFHSSDYLSTLRETTVTQFRQNQTKFMRYGLDDDCPVFSGLFDFCRLYSGASIEGASKLNSGQYDVAINWAGGLHHAKKGEASGFCYVNDCVLGILELLKVHPRVLYIDIDIHHGDGVEEAFYSTDRVMTLSLHLYRPEYFFPGTGHLEEIGEGAGRGYAVNVPLLEGCTDEEYLSLFKPIVQKIMDVYRPGAVVLQCGADALVGDRIGAFSLTLQGHAEAVQFVKSFNLPMLVLGGGGYTKTTVARAWTLDTATILGVDLPDLLPQNQYLEYYSPEYKLRYNMAPRFVNQNRKEELDRIRTTILENLRFLRHAPGQLVNYRPPDALLPDAELEDEEIVYERMRTYAQAHFAHYLKCVDAGAVNAYEPLYPPS